jgi:hypothetical protein
MFTKLSKLPLYYHINEKMKNSGGNDMIRAAIAGVVGFVLIFIESMIVMKIKGLETIEFGGLAPFINVWAMNFFFVFAILTQITNWYINKESLEEDQSF